MDASVYAVLGVEPKNEMDAGRIAERCALQMINEAALCFGEGILRSARDGDIGGVFGLGFPPFRGGPFRYVDDVGARTIVTRLEALRDLHGKRFAPAPVLIAMSKTGAQFHDEKRPPLHSHPHPITRTVIKVSDTLITRVPRGWNDVGLADAVGSATGFGLGMWGRWGTGDRGGRRNGVRCGADRRRRCS